MIVFIDGAYLDKLLEFNFNMAKIDYLNFVDVLADGVECDQPNADKVFYYHCPPYLPYNPNEFEKSRSANKMRFFGALNQLDRFNTRLGKLIFRGVNQETGRPIFMQKKITTQLATDWCREVTNGETIMMLVAGDSEYVPLVDFAQDYNCDVVLCHGRSKDRNNNMVHRSLLEACDLTYEITNDIIQECLR